MSIQRPPPFALTIFPSFSLPTHVAQDSVFTNSIPDDQAPEALLTHNQRFDAPLVPKQCPNLISGAVTMNSATFTAPLSSPVEFQRHFDLTAAPPSIQVASIVHPLRSFRPNGRYRRRQRILRPIYGAQIVECFRLPEDA